MESKEDVQAMFRSLTGYEPPLESIRKVTSADIASAQREVDLGLAEKPIQICRRADSRACAGPSMILPCQWCGAECHFDPASGLGAAYMRVCCNECVSRAYAEANE